MARFVVEIQLVRSHGHSGTLLQLEVEAQDERQAIQAARKQQTWPAEDEQSVEATRLD